MKKIIILSLLIYTAFASLQTQTHFAYSGANESLNTGKELYDLGKYAAARLYFEDYLNSAPPTDAGAIQEAEYYTAGIAYHLRVADAEDYLSHFLLVHPYSPYIDNARLMLASLMYENKSYNRAISYLKEIHEKNLNERDLAEKIFIEGYSYFQVKNYPKALESFSRLKQMDTRYNTTASYYYGYTQYTQGNFDEALPDFLNLENTPEYSHIVPYYIIQIYYNKKEYGQIMNRAEDLLAKEPDNPNNAELYRIVGEIAFAQKSYDKAVAAFKKYEELSPQVLRNDIYLFGLSYYHLKDYNSAVDYLSKVTTKADEISENAYLYIGNAYVKLNDKTKARLAYEAAIDTNFDKSVREVAMYNYALTTYETNAPFGESITAFERFLNEFPNSEYADNAYDYLSSVYMTTNNYKAAYESIKKIRKQTNELMGMQQYLLNQMGAQEFTAKNYKAAIELFTQSLAIPVNKKYEADSYYWRGESHYRAGNPEETTKDMKAYFAIAESKQNQNLKSAYYLAGYAYFSQKDYTNALSNFKKYESQAVNTKEPAYADAMNRIGDCYFYFRDFNNAIANYDKAIKAAPDNGDYPLFQIAYVNGLQRKYTTKISELEKLLNQYPNSQYADDAYYEIGRAYLMMENDSKTLETFERMLSKYPNSNLAPKAALEIGMVYFNRNELNWAIDAYNKVIEKYPGSEESRIALQSLETAYIESNNVAGYMTYAKTLGKNIQTNITNKEDSIMFVAAERQYVNTRYSEAIPGLTQYIEKYCETGRYCTNARYYLADSYYHTGNRDRALVEYEKLIQIPGNRFMEESVMRAGEISYDNEEYQKSLTYFTQLQEIASHTENLNIGRLGVLRSSYYLNDNRTTINIANEIINDTQSSAEVKQEARFNRAKAYVATNQIAQAIPDLEVTAADTKTRNGAESKYLLAEIYFKEDRLNDAENEITAFSKAGTPYHYWLAKSMVLLADIEMKRGDDFQAKQYLLSLQKNYKTKDEIQVMITTRLEEINSREQRNIIN